MMSIEEIEKIPFFFIIGRPRSGTTMLSTILDANRQTAMPIESKIIIFLYFKFKKVKNWDKKLLLKFYDAIFEEPKMDTWMINKAKLKEEILQLGEKATFQRLIKLIYLNYISFFEKENIIIIGDKNPGYSYVTSHFKILLGLFPEAKIIHLARDYRDHYLSMRTVDFEGNHLSLVCYKWKYSFLNIRKIMKNNPQNYYFLRYEDLVIHPEKEMTTLCSFLGITFHKSMLEYYKIKDKVLEKYTEEDVMKYHSSLFQPINADFVGKWKHKLTTKQIELADSIVGQTGIEAGYEQQLIKDKLQYKIYVLPDMLYSKLWLFYKRWYDNFFLPKKQKHGLMSQIYFFIFRR